MRLRLEQARESWNTVSKLYIGYDGLDLKADSTARIGLKGGELRGSRRLIVDIEQRFRIAQSGPRQFDTELLGYEDAVDDAQGGHEIMAFHWHRGVIDWAHIHMGAGGGAMIPELQRAHVPSGTVQLQDFVRFLRVDFGVAPLRDDWERVVGGDA